MSKVHARAEQLIALAISSSAAPGEASNAALAACKLIAKYHLLGPPAATSAIPAPRPPPAVKREPPMRTSAPTPWRPDEHPASCACGFVWHAGDSVHALDGYVQCATCGAFHVFDYS